jgi:aryl-alcohol dehydrogenase-like predicted oxidoreductase
MEFRKLGTTDLEISKICLGTMTWGQQNTEAEGHEQMDYAVEQGINFFDTAELYSVPAHKDTNGSTERIIGTWFKKTGKRKDIVLATKIAGYSPGLPFIRNHQLDFTPKNIHAALEGSFQRLQTDYADIYQLHWPIRKTNYFGQLGYTHDPNDKWEDDFLQIIETMADLIKQGKIRHWGVSNETAWGLMHFIRLAEKHNLPLPLSIQNPYNLLNRSFEVGLAECAIRENVSLLVYSPMGFGLLSGKYHKKTDKPEDRINQFKSLPRYNSAESWEATARYLAIAENHGLTLAEMSLAFVTQQPFVTSNIIGATSMAQLKENIGSAKIHLSAEILKEINGVHKAISNPAP